MRHAQIIVALTAGMLSIAACGTDSSTVSSASEDAAFWDVVSSTGFMIEAEEYGTLESMAQLADLVVVGTISALGVGRGWGPPEEPEAQIGSVVMQIDVAEVISGSLPDPTVQKVSLEHQLLSYTPEAAKEAISARLITDRFGREFPVPDEQALYFLRVRGDEGSELIEGEARIVGGVSYRLVSSQGLITQDGDTAVVRLEHPVSDLDGLPDPAKDPAAALVEAINGQRFEAVVEQARTASTR